MKVMMIDPWGVKHLMHYTNGVCKGISPYCDLRLMTNYYYENTSGAQYNTCGVFFKISEKLEHNKLRKMIRGVEYMAAYNSIIKELKSNEYDIVHIQWLLQYNLDISYLKRIKAHCSKLVYTAHNVVPHTNGEKYIEVLRQIYGIVDKIVLHGDMIKREFVDLFPEYENKAAIQNHGTYLNQRVDYDASTINEYIVNKLQNGGKTYIFFGNMFYNKGVDRLVRIWMECFRESEDLLIICGRKNAGYHELDALEEDISDCNSILYINHFVEDNLLHFLIDQSDLILLPYRHASMSGVVFTAAECRKPVLCTSTGSLEEYVVDEENSFVVGNSDKEFCSKLRYISKEIDEPTLAEMGERLHRHIEDEYSWGNIGQCLVSEVYRTE